MRKVPAGIRGTDTWECREECVEVFWLLAELVLMGYLCRIDMISPSTLTFGIFVEFDFDLWERKVIDELENSMVDNLLNFILGTNELLANRQAKMQDQVHVPKLGVKTQEKLLKRKIVVEVENQHDVKVDMTIVDVSTEVLEKANDYRVLKNLEVEATKYEKVNGSIGASLDPSAIESNFPLLHEQVVSSTVDEFVEQVAVTMGNTRDEVFSSTCLTGSTPIPNAIVTSMCKCTKVTIGMSNFTATSDMAMNIDIGSSVNLTDPHTSTAGLNSTNPVQSGIHNVINTGPISYINVVSPTSTSKNVSANKNGGEQVGNEHVNEFPLSCAAKLSPTSSDKAKL
nr:hypothetical protein [Tanacetum cinerariifolium]